ncbi:MAG: extracellular solute-binding protein, partial [Clostridiales bacterium]|nr:extracellular solute-binding protein [Clostridiales bacterium]
EWEWPAPGADTSQAFNILIASREYPDIIYDSQVSQAENLINDKVIISLNEILPDYAPNLWAYLQGNKDIDKGSKTDDGNYFMFPSLREDAWLCTYAGPIVRKDWLDEQNLEIPVTIEDVENVLRVFKDKYGARFGAIDQSNRWSVAIAGAYGIDRTTFYIDSNTVKFGPAEASYKDYVTLIKRWYDDGLIDPDFATLDDNTLASKMANNEIGYTVSASSQRDKWLLAAEKTNSGASFEPAPYPVLNEGDTTKFIQTTTLPGGDGAMITTASKNVELVARLLDYGYSEEGINYWNFGEEGVSYEMVDGVPTFTDLVVNDPVGKYDAVKKYAGTTANGPSIQLMNMWQQRNIPSATNAVNMWVGNTDPFEVKLPGALTPTVEEASEQSSLQNAIETYSSEMFYRFIFGDESLDNFDDYIETLNSMGLPRLLELKQAQYDRYLDR